jgi:hypothetical protein
MKTDGEVVNCLVKVDARVESQQPPRFSTEKSHKINQISMKIQLKTFRNQFFICQPSNFFIIFPRKFLHFTSNSPLRPSTHGIISRFVGNFAHHSSPISRFPSFN